MAPVLLEPGAILDGKYRIHRVLGQGAMGCVYEASHEMLGDHVAIKCLLQEQASPGAMERFLREAKVVRAIRSAHAVKVLEVGQLPDGNPFLVMELLQGNNLEEHLRSCGALAPQQVADFLIQACDGLAEAHKAGIVHRDLKPENLFLSRDPDGSLCLKVLDFGVAKVLVPESSTKALLRTAGPIGTPLFMSPEQIQGEALGVRSDLWALGVLMFYLLSECYPFESPTIEGLSVQICTATPRRLQELVPSLPEELSALVVDCLARDPAARPASVAELAERLRPFAPPSCGPLIERIHRILGLTVTPLPRTTLRSVPEEPPLSLARTLEESLDEPPPPEASAPSELASRAPSSLRWLPLLLGVPVLGLAGWWVQGSSPPPSANVSGAAMTGEPLPSVSMTVPPATAALPLVAPASVSALQTVVPPVASSAPKPRPSKPPSGPPPVTATVIPPTPPLPPPAQHTPPPDPKQSAIRDRK